MKVFTRDDGRSLQVVKGFRDLVRSYRPPATPRSNWSEEDYAAAADKKLRRWESILSEFDRWGGTRDGLQVLEIGCGAGIDCLLIAAQPVRRAVGIDLKLPLFEQSEKGDRVRRLASEVLERLNLGGDLDVGLKRLPVHFAIMNTSLMGFPNNSFDFLWSNSVMEHIMPIDRALAEMARLVRPGGLIYHRIDPYFWLRGCHKTALVDIPWAHARLSINEFYRFVAESEGTAQAARRCQRLTTLNRVTLRQWRKIVEAFPFEILEWKEESSPVAEMLLEEHPEVEESLLEGVERRDLTCGRIKVWMRNKAV